MSTPLYSGRSGQTVNLPSRVIGCLSVAASDLDPKLTFLCTFEPMVSGHLSITANLFFQPKCDGYKLVSLFLSKEFTFQEAFLNGLIV